MQPEPNEPKRRVAVLRVSGELFLNLCKYGLERPVEVVENPVPADAEIIGCYFNVESGQLSFVLRSESFAEVEDDGAVWKVSLEIPPAPMLPDPVFRTVAPIETHHFRTGDIAAGAQQQAAVSKVKP